MKWSFFIVITLCFIVLQTVILPCFSWFSHSFDLIIILVVFLSLNFSHYGVVAAIAGIGGIMDSLSGGPFFLYIFSYIWIFLIVQLVRQLVFQTSTLFVVAISLVSILIEQGLTFFSVFIQPGRTVVWQIDIIPMIHRAVWGSVMIPLGLWGVSVLYGNWQYMVRAFAKTREMKRR
jgi:hypothetical protein